MALVSSLYGLAGDHPLDDPLYGPGQDEGLSALQLKPARAGRSEEIELRLVGTCPSCSGLRTLRLEARQEEDEYCAELWSRPWRWRVALVLGCENGHRLYVLAGCELNDPALWSAINSQMIV